MGNLEISLHWENDVICYRYESDFRLWSKGVSV